MGHTCQLSPRGVEETLLQLLPEVQPPREEMSRTTQRVRAAACGAWEED